MLVSCEHAALIDGRDYLQPVITPWEAQVAFTHGSVWDGEVRLGFEHLLAPTSGDEKVQNLDNELGPECSFLDGQVRSGSRGGGEDDDDDDDDDEDSDSDDDVLGDGHRTKAKMRLAVRAVDAVARRAGGGKISDVQSGAQYLLTRRTYSGLEPGPKRDEHGAASDAPLEAATGMSGRARSYTNET